jgi:hypothetical protein
MAACFVNEVKIICLTLRRCTEHLVHRGNLYWVTCSVRSLSGHFLGPGVLIWRKDQYCLPPLNIDCFTA